LRTETEEARNLFKNEYNLTYKNISSRELFKLYSILKTELENYKIEGQFILMKKIKIQINSINFYEDGSIEYAFFRCKGSWFDDREAISFNRDGFIGFAGWSDDTNIIPFVQAFKKWLIWMKGENHENL